MPPKPQFSKKCIIDASFSIVSAHGWKGLSARAIAHELNSSTRPIYDHFESMKTIEEEIVKKIMTHFIEYITKERTGDIWLDQALGYVLFAHEEKQLFRCINDEKYIHLQKQFSREHWFNLGKKLTSDERFATLSEKRKEQIRIARWFFTHGMAFLVNSGWCEISEAEDLLFSENREIKLGELLDKVNQGLFAIFDE